MRPSRLAVGILAASAFAGAVYASSLSEGFASPPRSARPHTWYHMMNGNVSKAGITCDFEALARVGIGGVQMFDAGCDIPAGPVKFNSDDWFDLFRHAQREAKRLGLEICIPNCSGWSSSGGPWNMPSNAMKTVVFTETPVTGPTRLDVRLPRTERDNGFYADIAVLAYPTPAPGAALSGLPFKTFADRGNFRRDTGTVASDRVVDPASIADLTDRASSDGALVWDVPEGDWTVLRIGFACNGRRNHPASEKGWGLEVDKLSASAMDYHFAQYVSRLCRDLGIDAQGDNATGFNNILVDSYEVGCQNWTQGFDREFEKRTGYAIRPFLPVFAGRVVGSVDVSERFLEDFRRVVADLFAENYSGRLVELCHRHGLLCSVEPYGNCPADDLQYGQDVDIPMAEFWSNSAFGANGCAGTGNSRHAAHLAHVWGRRYAATESFTADPAYGGRWRTTPYLIKSQGDRVFAEGVNRIVYHRFTHQPWAGAAYLPGMTMGRWGMHLDRTQTWWELSPAWFAYQTRCQWMLQEGVFVADALFWCGEQAPNDARVNVGLPAGFAWDVCATRAVERLAVRDGRLVAPGGVSYALLVLPSTDTMSERMLRRLGELLDQGAKICARTRPTRAPGLVGYPQADDRVKALVDEIWAKGVFSGEPVAALKALGVEEDARLAVADGSWIHRRNAEADWYFVATDNAAPVAFTASFRETGRAPEFWDAETGSTRPAPVWRVRDGRTEVDLRFPPSGSTFVVFRTPSDAPHPTSVEATVASRPDPTLPEERHTLEIRKAEYGLRSKGKVVDITARVRAAVKDGRVLVTLDNAFAGGDPLPDVPKRAWISYVYDGEAREAEFVEHDRFSVPERLDAPQPPPDWEWREGRILAWQPGAFVCTSSDGATRVVKADPAAPVRVTGAWHVAFPAGWDAPASIEFPELIPWDRHPDDGVKYFSGTATYAKTVQGVRPPSDGGRVMLDLGTVRDFAEVKVNGRTYPVLWKPPFRLDVTDALEDSGRLALEIRVTNLWANRLIGDDRLYADDCRWSGPSHVGKKEIAIRELPQWVKEGKPSPTGRHTFTTWKHWSKEDELLPSGLLGPVMIRNGAIAGLD